MLTLKRQRNRSERLRSFDGFLTRVVQKLSLKHEIEAIEKKLAAPTGMQGTPEVHEILLQEE